ncbi:MAG: hypothetical protein ACFWTJ_09980 [Lachnoclostridium sp.]|jgi:hypothetical protein
MIYYIINKGKYSKRLIFKNKNKRDIRKESMKLNWTNVKSNKAIILPLYIFSIVVFKVLFGSGIGDIWDWIIAKSLNKNKRSTL